MLRFKQNLCLLWFLWCLLHCNAKKPLKSSMKNGYFHELYDDNYAESFNSMNNLFVNNVYTNLKLPEIKTSCANDILNIILGIYQKQSWALQWLDATAHPPPGILGGAMHWVGSYDVCLKCSGYHSIGEKEEPKFHGSYCTMVFDMNTSIAIIPELRMSVGLCMPNTCTSEEVRSIINTTAYYLLLRLNQKESFCHRFVGDVQKDTWYYIAVSICSALTILVVIATSIDMFLYIQWYHVQNLNKYITGTNHISERSSIENVNHIEEQTHPLIESDGIVNNDQERENVRKIDEKHLTTFNEYRKSVLEKRILTKILCAYSLPINTMKLCAQRMEDDKSSRTYNISLTFLDGIRCMSMIWIIGGHILLHGYKLTNNLMILAGEFRRIWLFGMYFNGHLAPDIFFFMSGLLMCYLCMGRLTNLIGVKNHMKFWSMLIVHRFIRLTPAYLVTVIFFTGLLNHIYDGPFFPQDIHSPVIENCRKYWYFLYLTNVIDFRNSCLQWSWYIANDIQYTVILAPIFITLLVWKRITGILFAISFILLSSLITYFTAYIHSFEIMDIAKDEIYVRPYTRCGAYMIGMLTGWLLYEYPRLEMRNTRRNQFFIVSIGYLVAAFLFVLPIFISYGVLSGLLTEMSRKTAAAYLAFHRVSFTLGIGISVYLCAIGWGKPIYNTFAWSGFRVPARLTYSAYLIHPIIVTIFINGAQTPFIIDQLEVVRLTASTTVFSYIVAYILSMTTEYPISTLEKYLFR
uniref:NRF domain-containing protein n=1 Tax=Schistosoma mansoni TaxID=6183 RepID=A0A3Q0KRI4_SCHMA